MFDSNQFFSGGAAGFYPKTIEQSLRFNDDDSAYLSRTPSSAGNQKTWTISFWIKRANIDALQWIYLADSDTWARFEGSQLIFNNRNGGTNYFLSFAPVFRDPSSWYHFVIACDTTQATDSDRFKLYVNGEQITTLGSYTTYPPQNHDTEMNEASLHRFFGHSSGSNYFDGYCAEFHFTDGTAYTADAFGEFKENVWVAKAPSVTYGTNGFYLDFANGADIGNDVSGEGNDWTPNNFTASDVVLDSPTNNFCTMNPIAKFGTPSAFTLADGNLDLTFTATSGNDSAVGTMGLTSGKWYHEVTLVSQAGDSNAGFTTAEALATETATNGAAYYKSVGYHRGDRAIIWGTEPTPTQRFTTLSDGSVLGFALDLDSTPQTLKIYLNGVASPIVDVELPTDKGNTWIPCCGDDGGNAGQFRFDFGQLGFTYTPPTGFNALSTANLPDPAIDPAQGSSPQDYFGTLTYDGSGSTQTVTGLDFEPNFVWIKSRSNATSHYLHNSVRGDTKYLFSNDTADEDDWDGTGNGMVQFVDGGFELSGGTGIDGGSRTYVAWNWKAGGEPTTDNVAGVGNVPTAGSVKIDGVDSTSALAGSVAAKRISANTEAGFSIIQWDATTNATIATGLNQQAEMVIVREFAETTDWPVYHKDATTADNKTLYLNTTNAIITVAVPMWDVSEFSSSVIGIGSNGRVNSNAIAFCFHSVPGFSKFGSYTGATNGVFVYLGFRPAFVMIKNTGSSSWWMMDSKRDTYNVMDDYLIADNTTFGTYTSLDFLSNGFRTRNTSSSFNTNGATHIYMAFAENPFKYSNAR